ncbi:uncharacterized protein LOC116296115 [Actinia tenebrosa]|uniref:Uncharacterized protein LOC116296115 n=1 Tax=Actinia tenebrosa TaxID=6105 RepID=A0A6P8HX77_ACTTE|nr:uncharacterized protein LOC116296115 [Actinia tenebrosa]
MYWFKANYILSVLRPRDSFIVKPDEEVYSKKGSNVTLEWYFHVGAWSSSLSNGVFEFRFGVWDDPGYVKNEILAVRKRNAVIKRRGFERKVKWSGNIYDCVNCTARVVMYNLTDVDFKKYGVEVEVSLDRSHLTNWLRLVKFEPAEIINSSWSRERRIVVAEGNATTIECKATGRPTPSVIIKKRNRTLCNDSTGHCVYEIREAKPEDEGEHLCLVQQRNYRPIRRSFNLTVVKGRNTINTTQDEFHKTNIVVIALLGAVGVVLVLVVIVFLFKRVKFCKSNSEQQQQLRKNCGKNL